MCSIPFTNIINKMGPKIEPRGTLEMTLRSIKLHTDGNFEKI